MHEEQSDKLFPNKVAISLAPTKYKDVEVHQRGGQNKQKTEVNTVVMVKAVTTDQVANLPPGKMHSAIFKMILRVCNLICMFVGSMCIESN